MSERDNERGENEAVREITSIASKKERERTSECERGRVKREAAIGCVRKRELRGRMRETVSE